jgi:hypothetical protein
MQVKKKYTMTIGKLCQLAKGIIWAIIIHYSGRNGDAQIENRGVALADAAQNQAPPRGGGRKLG